MIKIKRSVLFLCISGISFLHAINGTGSLSSGNITRTYSYHAPGSSVGPNLPVVIMMHGDGGTGAGIQSYCGMDAVADLNNFLVIYPDAVGGSWNRYVDNVPGDAGLMNPTAPDDVLFISDLIDHVCTTYQINASRVYASGHSAGGFMAYDLAITLNSKIAAFAPVSANLWGDNAFITNYFTNDYVAVPILHIHGDADNVVDYPDPDFTPMAYEEWPLSGFSAPNCGSTTYTSTSTIVANVQSLIFCAGSVTEKRVELVRMMGQGHGWASIPGFNAASHIWNFCSLYSDPTAPGCGSTAGISDEGSIQQISVYPVPATDRLYIKGELPSGIDVLVTNSLGQVRMEINDFKQSSLPVTSLTPGVYFLSLRTASQSKSIRFIVN